jgi:hypothetical protein
LASADTLNSPNITSAQARSQPTDIQRTPEIHEKSGLRASRLKNREEYVSRQTPASSV